MKSFRDFMQEDGVVGGISTAAPATNTSGISGAGDNPDKTVPVSKKNQQKIVKNAQPTLRHRQARVGMVRPQMEEMKYKQASITASNSKTSKDPTGFVKIGDKGHLGFAVKGGVGFRGVVSKIEKDMVTIRSGESGKWRPKEYHGHVNKFTKDD